MRFIRHVEQVLKRHKIARYIYTGIIAIIGMLFIILIFSWDWLLGWIITKEKSELNAFIFWATFAVVVITATIVISIIINRKKK